MVTSASPSETVSPPCRGSFSYRRRSPQVVHIRREVYRCTIDESVVFSFPYEFLTDYRQGPITTALSESQYNQCEIWSTTFTSLRMTTHCSTTLKSLRTTTHPVLGHDLSRGESCLFSWRGPSLFSRCLICLGCRLKVHWHIIVYRLTYLFTVLPMDLTIAPPSRREQLRRSQKLPHLSRRLLPSRQLQ
jgi:hypothetical protein